MEPERELDSEIAEKVFGCHPVNDGDYLCQCSDSSPHGQPGLENIHEYSTDISAAWEVVEKTNDTFSLENKHEWECDRFDGFKACFGGACAIAETAPHAICLAALKAVEVSGNSS